MITMATVAAVSCTNPIDGNTPIQEQPKPVDPTPEQPTPETPKPQDPKPATPSPEKPGNGTTTPAEPKEGNEDSSPSDYEIEFKNYLKEFKTKNISTKETHNGKTVEQFFGVNPSSEKVESSLSFDNFQLNKEKYNYVFKLVNLDKSAQINILINSKFENLQEEISFIISGFLSNQESNLIIANLELNDAFDTYKSQKISLTNESDYQLAANSIFSNESSSDFIKSKINLENNLFGNINVTYSFVSSSETEVTILIKLSHNNFPELIKSFEYTIIGFNLANISLNDATREIDTVYSKIVNFDFELKNQNWKNDLATNHFNLSLDSNTILNSLIIPEIQTSGNVEVKYSIVEVNQFSATFKIELSNQKITYKKEKIFTINGFGLNYINSKISVGISYFSNNTVDLKNTNDYKKDPSTIFTESQTSDQILNLLNINLANNDLSDLKLIFSYSKLINDKVELNVNINYANSNLSKNAKILIGPFIDPEIEAMEFAAKNNYQVSLKTEQIKKFNIGLYSASINEDNWDKYINFSDQGKYLYELESINLKPNNINTALIKFKLWNENKSKSVDMLREVSSELDLNPIINEISINSLSDAFNFDPSIISKFSFNEIFNKENFSNYFFSKTKRFFKFSFNKVISINESETGGRISINLMFNDQIIKSFEVETSSWKIPNLDKLISITKTEKLNSLLSIEKIFDDNGIYKVKENQDFSPLEFSIYKTFLEVAKEHGFTEELILNDNFKANWGTLKEKNWSNDYINLFFLVSVPYSDKNMENSNPETYFSNYIKSDQWKKITLTQYRQIMFQTILKLINFNIAEGWSLDSSELNDDSSSINLESDLRDRYFLYASQMISFTPNRNNLLFTLKLKNNLGIKKIKTINTSLFDEPGDSNDVELEIREYLASFYQDFTQDLSPLKPIHGMNHSQVTIENADLSQLFQLPKYQNYQLKFRIDKKDIATNSISFYIDAYRKDENGNLAKKPFRNRFSNLTPRSVTLSNFKPLNDFVDENGTMRDTDFTSSSEVQKTQNWINFNTQVKQINGSDFKLIRSVNNNYSYLDPNFATSKNLKYFLNFTGASQSTTSEGNFTLQNGVSEDNPTNVPTKVAGGSISNDPETNIQIGNLRQNYWFTYYDVKNIKGSAISFKIGFISKTNPDVKAFSNTITLSNLKNDLDEIVYPAQDLNLIDNSNNSLNISFDISQKTSEEWVFEFNSKKEQSYFNQQLVSVNLRNPAFKFKKYHESDKYYFRVHEVKVADANKGSMWVRFEFVNKSTTKEIVEVANTWILVTGAKSISGATSLKSDLNLMNELNTNSNLTQVVFDSTKIGRNRKIELAKKDAAWSLDEEKNMVSFTLKNKYFEQVLKPTNGATNLDNSIIKVNFKTVVNNTMDQAIKFINERGFSVEFSYNELLENKKIDKNGFINPGVISNKHTNLVSYFLTITKVDSGIHFEFKTPNNYKISLDFYKDAFWTFAQLGSQSAKVGEFTPGRKEVYFDKYATSFEITYFNDKFIEVFDEHETNTFNYDNVHFTQLNEPMIIYNENNKTDPFKYNPNQNVKFKWNYGYKSNMEYAYDDYNYEAINEIKARTFAGSNGSMTMLSKVNDDPFDLRYYIVTNNHVINSTDNPGGSQLGLNKPFRLTKHANNFENIYQKGFSYWSGNYVAAANDNRYFWDGNNQISRGGSVKNRNVDYTITVLNVAPMILEAKKEGRFEMATWLENWINLKPLSLSYTATETISPISKSLTYDYSFSGFPYGKLASYLYRRVGDGNENISFRGENLHPVFHNAGNSGTGVLDNEGNYIAAINSGAPLSSLVAWKLISKDYDYWGGDEENISTLDKENVNSFVAQLLRFNAFDSSFKIFTNNKNKNK
ncbi:MGA_1079 family surface serine endopeptidase [Mycoplasma testudineum]|nr:hypothetical protein [Mycoplasma testudineum]